MYCICLQPNCLTKNPSDYKFCYKCGKKLLLVERYRAIAKIGEGGFGKTFKAIDELKPSKSLCVIKQFAPQAQGTNNIEKAGELFAQEAVRLDQLGKHPQIPNLLAYFSQEEQQYLVQEFIDGQNLLQELESKGVFNEVKIRKLLIDVLTVLKFVHENKVIHRDIKPENIIRRKSNQKLILVDFGAAKMLTNINLSVTGTVIGSAQYTAPEQARGKPRYASDLYSLGITCLELLTGMSPFDLYSDSEGDWVWRDYLVDNPVSDELGEILDKLIENAIKRRYKSVTEVLAVLNPSVSNFPSSFNTKLSSFLSVKNQPSPSSQSTQIQTPPKPPQLKTFKFNTTIITGYQPGGFLGIGKKVETKNISNIAQYFTENLGNGVTLDMIYLKGGSFMMGSNNGDKDEKPVHKVTLKEFYLGKFPITQAQYQTVMGENPSHFKGDNRPVERVSWNDAVKFCQRLSQKTGKRYRLPSEAQWEYACRAGSTEKYCFGDDKSLLKEYAWYRDNSNFQTYSVGEKKPNPWGLYDMHGNVWEWCEDDYVDNYYNRQEKNNYYINEYKNYKVLRGGSWFNYSYYCASSSRINDVPRSCDINFGFRIMCIL